MCSPSSLPFPQLADLFFRDDVVINTSVFVELQISKWAIDNSDYKLLVFVVM